MWIQTWSIRGAWQRRSNGIIWVSDNGTGVSTLYNQAGVAKSLIVTIPGSEDHRPGNPTGE